MKKLMNKKKGFTLVELLVVVAIIAILMLLALPRFMDSTRGAKLKTFEGNFRTTLSQITQYQANNGGSTQNIEQATSDVQRFITTLGNKPQGATYQLTNTTFTATLPAAEIPSATADYVITYTFATGNITQQNAPAGAGNLENIRNNNNN